MPESVVEATASAVTHKQLNRKSDGRSFTLYNVETDMGTFTTSKRDLAKEAHALVGRMARYTVKTEQRGEFTNYYLEAVEAVDGAGSRSAFPEQMPQPKQHQPPEATLPPAEPPPKPIGDPAGPTDRDVFIFRQTAAKVAALVSRTPDEFWGNVQDITAYFVDGSIPLAAPEAAPGDDPDDSIPF